MELVSWIPALSLTREFYVVKFRYKEILTYLGSSHLDMACKNISIPMEAFTLFSEYSIPRKSIVTYYLDSVLKNKI